MITNEHFRRQRIFLSRRHREGDSGTNQTSKPCPLRGFVSSCLRARPVSVFITPFAPPRLCERTSSSIRCFSQRPQRAQRQTSPLFSFPLSVPSCLREKNPLPLPPVISHEGTKPQRKILDGQDVPPFASLRLCEKTSPSTRSFSQSPQRAQRQTFPLFLSSPFVSSWLSARHPFPFPPVISHEGTKPQRKILSLIHI